MFKVVTILSFLAVAAFARTDDFGSHWENFKKVHEKKYEPTEELYRRQVFNRNLRFIINHNIGHDLGVHSFRLGVNKFADLTNQEFAAQYNGYKGKKTHSNLVYRSTGANDLPTEVDWRDKGLVTGVKNQGQCGSCWAFSAIASLEGQHAKATGNLTSLSEQNLVDCSTPEGNQGCNGGLMDQAYDYIKKNNGVDTEASYPYEAQDDTCRYKKSSVGARVTGYVDIKSGDEQALTEAAANIGPIAVAIDASSIFFQLYFGGVYDQPSCHNGPDQLDHGVTVVGYGTENGKDYYLVKNSWGGSWGESGYIKMSRGKNNQCGIATQASYPLV